MKKIPNLLFLLLSSFYLFAQTPDYRTTEDGINKLLSNPEFVEDVINLSTEEFSFEKLDGYFAKYVPEYKSFNVNSSAVDVNNLYFANTGTASPEALAGKLGVLLKLDPAQAQNLKNLFTGNTVYTPTTNYSTGLTDLFYERGKNEKVDYTVDYAVDFFQNKFGDGGMNSALIDIGGGLLGMWALEANRQNEIRMAEEARLEKIKSDFRVYETGYTRSRYDKKQLVTERDTGQEDLFAHYRADAKVPGNGLKVAANVDYEGAIKLYSEAIKYYRVNQGRGYYLYMAYMGRARAKMQVGGYRAAIVDYYFAEGILKNLLTGKLADKSVKAIYPPGYFIPGAKGSYNQDRVKYETGSLSHHDYIVVFINRAFAKYRAGNFAGAIADCKLASDLLLVKNIAPANKPNDYKDIIKAVVAMSQFGLNDYKAAYQTFTNANLSHELIADSDEDGVADFADMAKAGQPGVLDEDEGIITVEYYGLPDYFAFDIVQIKGLAYYKAGKIDNAIEAYQKIYTSENGNSTLGGSGKKMFTRVGGDISAVYATLASFYYEKGDKEKAVSLLDEAIQLNPAQREYYFKRGVYKKAIGKTSDGEADLEFARNPAAVNTSKKSREFYNTKYAEYSAAGKTKETYQLLKEALQDFNDSEVFFMWMIKTLSVDKVAAQAQEAAGLVSAYPIKHHVLKSVAAEYAGNDAEQEQEMFLAFKNGLNFYQASTTYQIVLNTQIYYCKLFATYGTKDNNNFGNKDLDREAMVKYLDSILTVQINLFKGMSLATGILTQVREEQKAKFSGNVQEYLSLLNKKTMYVAQTALDKIECLFILNRDEDAVNFAKKIAPKILEIKSDPMNPASGTEYKAVLNIAKGLCN